MVRRGRENSRNPFDRFSMLKTVVRLSVSHIVVFPLTNRAPVSVVVIMVAASRTRLTQVGVFLFFGLGTTCITVSPDTFFNMGM